MKRGNLEENLFKNAKRRLYFFCPTLFIKNPNCHEAVLLSRGKYLLVMCHPLVEFFVRTHCHQREYLRSSGVTRPEKSLHNLVRSPSTNLHFLVSPEMALHLITG